MLRPAPYMRAVRRILGEAGFDMARYHEESFGSTPAEVAEDVIEHAEAAAEALDQADLVGVTFADSDKHVRVPRARLFTPLRPRWACTFRRLAAWACAAPAGLS